MVFQDRLEVQEGLERLGRLDHRVHRVILACLGPLVVLDRLDYLALKDPMVRLDFEVIQVSEDPKDLMEQLDLLDKWVPLVLGEQLVVRELQAHLELQEHRVMPDQADHQEVRELEVCLDCRENPDCQELQDSLVILDFLDRQDPQVSRDLQELLGILVRLETPGQLEMSDCPGPLDQTVHQVLLVLLGQTVRRGLGERLEREVMWGQRVPVDRLVHQDREGRKALQDNLDYLVHLELMDNLDQQDLQVLLDQSVHEETQDLLVLRVQGEVLAQEVTLVVLVRPE